MVIEVLNEVRTFLKYSSLTTTSKTTATKNVNDLGEKKIFFHRWLRRERRNRNKFTGHIDLKLL
jgi:hypothetical protein